MNLYQVVKSLQTIALTNPYIRNVGDGSIYDFMDANPSIKYGVFFVSQTNHREDEYFDWYGFNLFVIDRLVDNLESNRLQIQSIAKDVLSNTIQTFITKFIGITHTEIRYTPFTQKFSDLCAGEYCSIEFRIPKAIVCEEDYKDIIPIIPDCPECEDCNTCYSNGYESGYTDGVNSVECPDYTDYWNSGYTSGYTDGENSVDCTPLYNSGYTGGYESGFTDGVNSVDCTPLYNSGYTAGIDYQKSLLSSTAITHNGEYVSENGWSAVTVNVPQTGYTEQDLINAFNSGYTNGYNSGYTDGLNDCPECETDEYLTIEALSAGTLYWSTNSSAFTKTIEFRKNDGTWTSVTSSSGDSGTTVATVVAGDKIYLRGDNSWYCDTVKQTYFVTDFEFNVYGNIMSLINSTNYVSLKTLTEPHALCSIFVNCNKLISAKDLILPATVLSSFCYDAMFYGCTSLTQVPKLPATTLAQGCYKSMFQGCTSLTTAPELPATNLATYCYQYMFEGCTILNYIKCLATDVNTVYTGSWVESVASVGTFVKKAGVSWGTGNNGIPSGWSVIEE